MKCCRFLVSSFRFRYNMHLAFRTFMLPLRPSSVYVAYQLHRQIVRQLARSSSTKMSKFRPLRNASDSLCSVKVMGTGGNNVFPAIFVEYHDKAYMFNCGEGTFGDVKELSKNPVFFSTKGSWENIGGMVELFYAVTLGSSYSNEEPIVCSVPSSLHHMYSECLSRITGRNTWRLHEDLERFEDDYIAICGTEINPPGCCECVIAYSCRLRKANISLKSRYSNHALVSKTKDQMLENGIVEEKGNHNTEPTEEKNSTFLVIECPSKSFAEEICKCPHLNADWFTELNETVDLVVHITPWEVLQTETYCSWMARFGAKTHHLILHSSVCPSEILRRKALLLSTAFHRFNPNIYHVPCVPDKSAVKFTEMEISKFLAEDQVTVGCTGLKFNLVEHQPLSIDSSGVLEPIDKWLQNSFQIVSKQCERDFKEYHKLIGITNRFQNGLTSRTDSFLSPSNRNDFVVTFLGTSAKWSSSFRNTTGILVETLADGNLLLDCGEGTLKQLYSCFGKEHGRAVLRNIQNIFISHLHPDHFVGLFSVLTEIFEANGNTRINVIGPSALELHLRLYSKCYPELDYNYLNAKMGLLDPFVHQGLCVKTIPVNHVRECYGVKISTERNKSIVYSGDTKPCSKLINEGRNTDFLIHEATFLQHVNFSSRHSTYREAVRVSKAMNASFTVLTHFATKNTLLSLKERMPRGIIPAVDFMSIRLSDIQGQHLDSLESRFAHRAITYSMQRC